MPANDGRHGPKSHRALIKTISIAAAAIGALALAACTSTTTSPPVSATPAAATGSGAGPRGHPHRGGFDVRRPVLRPGLRQIPPAAPCGHRGLLRRGQQRGHRRDQRRAGRLRRLRRAHDRQRASRRQRRPGHPGARRPGRRRHRLQPGPPRGRPAAPDRPGPRGHLPRPDHALERPGHHRPQPRRHPPGRVDLRRAPLRRQRHHLHLQQLPVQRRPGLGGQGRHRQDAELAGRGRGRRQRQRDLHGFPHPLLHRIRRAGLFPGPGPAVRRNPQPGRKLRPPVHPDHRRRRRPETRHHPDRLLHRQPARRQQLPHQRIQLGADLHPPG